MSISVFMSFMMEVESCTRRWQLAANDDQKADANAKCNLKSLKELYGTGVILCGRYHHGHFAHLMM